MIYYSGAITSEQPQNIPSNSLGGYKSSSLIPNGEIHNLFPKITQHDILQNRKITRMIVFKNETPNTLTNLRIWIEDGQYSTILMNGVYPMYDERCSIYSFEKIASETSVPYQGTFESKDESNPLTISSLEPNQMIGIWLQKVLRLDQFNDIDKGIEPKGELTEEYIQILKSYQEQNQIFEDKFHLHFEWD